MGRGGTRPYPLDDGALEAIRTLSHLVAVPFLQTAKVNDRNAYGKEAYCLSHGSWVGSIPLSSQPGPRGSRRRRH